MQSIFIAAIEMFAVLKRSKNVAHHSNVEFQRILQNSLSLDLDFLTQRRRDAEEGKGSQGRQGREGNRKIFGCKVFYSTQRHRDTKSCILNIFLKSLIEA